MLSLCTYYISRMWRANFRREWVGIRRSGQAHTAITQEEKTFPRDRKASWPYFLTAHANAVSFSTEDVAIRKDISYHYHIKFLPPPIGGVLDIKYGYSPPIIRDLIRPQGSPPKQGAEKGSPVTFWRPPSPQRQNKKKKKEKKVRRLVWVRLWWFSFCVCCELDRLVEIASRVSEYLSYWSVRKAWLSLLINDFHYLTFPGRETMQNLKRQIDHRLKKLLYN